MCRCRRTTSCLSHPCGHAREPPREGGRHARGDRPHYIGIPQHPARHRQRGCSRGSPPARQSRLENATIRSCEPNREALSSRGSISRSHWSNVGLRLRSTAATTAVPMASIAGPHAGQQISLAVRAASRCTEQPSGACVRVAGWPCCGGAFAPSNPLLACVLNVKHCCPPPPETKNSSSAGPRAKLSLAEPTKPSFFQRYLARDQSCAFIFSQGSPKHWSGEVFHEQP